MLCVVAECKQWEIDPENILGYISSSPQQIQDERPSDAALDLFSKSFSRKEVGSISLLYEEVIAFVRLYINKVA